MEASAPRSAPSPAVSEKALDTVLSLLETVRCLTSIANLGCQSDARQTLAVGSAPAQTNNKTLESDERVRIAILEKELKQERAAKEDTLSSLHQVLQLCGPSTIEYPHQPSAGFEKVGQIKNLQQRLSELDETKEENERLKRRFLSATRQKTGYVEPHSVPETPEKPEKLQRDKNSGILTSNDDSSIEQAPESPLDIKYIPDEDVQDVDIRGVEDHQQEVPHDFLTSRIPPVDDQIPVDAADYDFRTLEDILADDDAFEVAAKRGLRDLDLITGSEAIYKKAPGVLETGLDAGRVRFTNEKYTLDQVDQFDGRRYNDHRPRGFVMDRYEPATGGENYFRNHRPGVVPGDNPAPDFLKYGLYYNPPSNIFRTVHIGNLPLGIKTSQLTSRVRGGQIISATICDTATLTRSMSALVVFLNADEAAAYAQFSKSHTIVFESQPATVTLLNTSTWPLSKPSCRRIIDQGQTRCLSILLFAKAGMSRKGLVRHCRDILRQLFHHKLYRAYRRSSLDTMSLDDDGRIHISFSSVYAATLAFDILKNPRSYRTCTISFEKDPCSRSLDDLLAPTGPGMDEAREIIPTDGDDLGDVDDDELTDMDAEDLSYRRTGRQRYRDTDKSPPDNVDELSYSDVNNVAVPQFGGPLIHVKDPENVSTVRRLPARPNSQSPRRRSWADEVNEVKSREEYLGPLITLDSSMEEDDISILPATQLMIEKIYSETETAAVNAPKGKGRAEVCEIPALPAIGTTLPTANVDARVELSNNSTIAPQSKLKSFSLGSQSQADNGTVLVTTPRTLLREDEPSPTASPSNETALVPPSLKEATPPTMPRTARYSLQAEAIALSSKKSANDLRKVAAITSTIETPKPLAQRMAASSTARPGDTVIVPATAIGIVSSVQNPDEIDLDLGLDTSPILTVSASKPAANNDITDIKPYLTSPLIPLHAPASTSAPASEPKLKISSSGSISGPSHTAPTFAIRGISLNPRKNFKGCGLLTSKYATSSPGSEDIAAAPGIGNGTGAGTGTGHAPEPETGTKHAMISEHLKGMGRGDGGVASGSGENQGVKRGQPTSMAETTPKVVDFGMMSTKSVSGASGSPVNRGRSIIQWTEYNVETAEPKFETETEAKMEETKNQVLSTTKRSITRAKSGSEPSNESQFSYSYSSSTPSPRLFPPITTDASDSTDSTAVAAPSPAAAVPSPGDATALSTSSTLVPSAPSPIMAAPASAAAASPAMHSPASSSSSSSSLGSSADGDRAADSGSEGR